MYQYKYVTANLGDFFTDANHHEVIEKYTKEGWRLLQVLPTNYNLKGRPTEYEIIFEREIDNQT